MYDDLVKAIRQNTCHFDACGMCPKRNALCVDRMALQAADAIEELSKSQWIPVTERLPEEGVSVQVCFRSQGGIAQAVSERFVNDRNQSYWSGLCGMKPTHWMPLPQPPKEE